jgi:hypothetical protein
MAAGRPAGPQLSFPDRMTAVPSIANTRPNAGPRCAARWCSIGVRFGCLLFLGLVGSARPAKGQVPWEYAPYQVRIWLALPDDPTWQNGNFDQLRHVLLGRAEAAFGSVWSCEVEPAPVPLASDIRFRLEDLTVEQVQAELPKGYPADKIYLVGLTEEDGLLKLQIRELDYRARQLGIVLQRSTPQRDDLPWQIWDGIAQAFTPVARIERVTGNEISARIRGGGLITSETSPAWIKKGAALRPVIRRNDRFGEPAKGGISLVNWTMLEVEQQATASLTCKLQTGYRSPIPAKANSRLERLALLVQPQFPATTLHLRGRDANATPLAGYEVWRKTEGLEGILLGYTDWRGDIQLPQAETGALQTLLIKSGGQLLARLPLVPGQQPRMEATVVNDDSRLQAEGMVQSLQSRVLDLEARRQITAARLRSKIKENKFDDAQQLLDEFRTIETRTEVIRWLDQQVIKSPVRTTQKRMDQLIVSVRTLLNKYLDHRLEATLQQDLVKAKAKPAAPATKPATPVKPATTPTPPAPAPQPNTPMPMP